MTGVRATSPAEWADVCSSAFVPLRVRATAPSFTATLKRTQLRPDVSVTRVASDGSEVFRNARMIAAHPRDDLLVSVHGSGRGALTQHGRQARLVRGSAAVYDASAPYTLRFPSRMSEVVLQVPRRLIARTGHAFTDLTATPLPPSASMTALQNLLWSVGTDTACGAMERELLAEAATTLLQGALLPAATTTAPQLTSEGLALAIRAYIDENLTDTELTVERLAHAHHVSLRLVYKAFAAHFDESPGAYLRRKRLALGHTRLIGGDTVSRTALHCGFTDPDTFTRAFKRQYGYPPSVLKPTAGPDGPVTAPSVER